MHADVAERPGSATQLRVHPPVRVGAAGQPVLQVGAVHEPHPPRLAGGDAGARLAHERVEAVDERYRRRPLGSPGRRRPGRGRPRPRWPAASRRRRPCRARAPAGPAARGWRSGVQMCTTSTSSAAMRSAADSAAASAPSRSAASRAACGVVVGHLGQPAARRPDGVGVDTADEAATDDPGAKLVRHHRLPMLWRRRCARPPARHWP